MSPDWLDDFGSSRGHWYPVIELGWVDGLMILLLFAVDLMIQRIKASSVATYVSGIQRMYKRQDQGPWSRT